MQQAIEEAKKMLSERAEKYATCKDFDIFRYWSTVIRELIERLESLKDDHLPQYYGWISVKDRLPEVWQDVLVLDRWTFHYDSYLKSNGMWFINNTFYTEEAYASNVTHWQPLPNQPVLPSNK